MTQRTQLLAASVLLLAALALPARAQYLEAAIPVGDTPVDVLWNPTSNKVYCSNEQSASVTVISGVTNQVMATIGVAEYPIALAWNSHDNKVYCVSGESDRLTVIDGVGDTVIATVALSGFPNSMVYTPSANKLYVTCYDNGRLRVLDGATDDVVASIAVGEGPFRPAWNPLSNRVFCPLDYAYTDSIAVVDCRSDIKVNCFAVADMLYRVDFNPLNCCMYAASSDHVHVAGAMGDSVLDVLPVHGFDLQAAAMVPFPNKLYVGDFNEGTITVIDCNANTVLDTTVNVVRSVTDLICDTAHARVYAAVRGGILVFDARADTLVANLQLDGYQEAFAWNRTDSRIYVSDEAHDVVNVIRDTTAGIVEEPVPQPRSASMMASPNPFSADVELSGGSKGEPPAELRVYSRTGKQVAVLHPARAGAGRWRCEWDGRDELGRPVPAGVYFVRYAGYAARSLVKISTSR